MLTLTEWLYSLYLVLQLTFSGVAQLERTHRICSPPVRSKQVRNIPKRIVRGHSHPECVKAEAIEIGFVLIAASVNGTISFLHYLDCAQGRKIWREIVIIELSCRDYDRLLQLPFTHFNHTHTDFLWTVSNPVVLFVQDVSEAGVCDHCTGGSPHQLHGNTHRQQRLGQRS